MQKLTPQVLRDTSSAGVTSPPSGYTCVFSEAGVVKQKTPDGTVTALAGSGGSGITQTQGDARYLQLTGGTLTGDTTLGDASGVNSRYFNVYQGPGGIAGNFGSIWAGYNNFYLRSPDGHVVVEKAIDEPHALYIQESGGLYQGTQWWFDGAAQSGTGGWMSVPAGAPVMNFRLGVNDGTGSLKVRQSGGTVAHQFNSDGSATMLGKLTLPSLQVTGGTPAAGKVLTSDATGNATWQAAAGGSTGITRNISTITTAVTIGAAASTDYVVFVGSGGVPTLPTAVGNTNLYTVKNIDNTNKTLATTSSQTIDGSASATLTPNTSLALISDGANWRVV